MILWTSVLGVQCDNFVSLDYVYPKKSGTYSVQVVSKFDGRYKLEMSFGASLDEKILKELECRVSEWIAQYGDQMVFYS